VSLAKKFHEVARSQSLHGGEPQTSRRPQWRNAGWAESQARDVQRSSPLQQPPLVLASDSDAASLIARFTFPARKRGGVER
jgi:hypothetical protein